MGENGHMCILAESLHWSTETITTLLNDSVHVFAPSSLTLFYPMDCSPPGSSVHGIFQAGILEWVAISCFMDLLDPGVEPMSPSLAQSLPLATWEAPGGLYTYSMR